MTTETLNFQNDRAILSAGTLDYSVAGQGRPLLYLHSAGGVRYSAPLETLSESHRVYVPKLPGFDGTPCWDGVGSVRELAGLVAEFLAQVTDGPVDVVGHSFGGWTAMWLAVLCPERVGQLVLESPAGLNTTGGSLLGGNAEDARRRMYAHPERVPTENKTPEVVSGNRDALQRYRGSMTGADEDLVARLGEIEAFTLILQGTKDGIIPATTSQLLKARLKHAYLMYIHDAAHNIEVDQPERFSRRVNEFLLRGEAFIINFGEGVKH